MPPGSVEGGRDDEPLFVGRAQHEGALIPGKVKPSHSVCYIAWGGEEHGKTDYQVTEYRGSTGSSRSSDSLTVRLFFFFVWETYSISWFLSSGQVI